MNAKLAVIIISIVALLLFATICFLLQLLDERHKDAKKLYEALSVDSERMVKPKFADKYMSFIYDICYRHISNERWLTSLFVPKTKQPSDFSTDKPKLFTRPIGSTFIYDSPPLTPKKLQVVEADILKCEECFFSPCCVNLDEAQRGACTSSERLDNKSVYFKLIESCK